MAIREIRTVPDPVLRTPCETIREITPAVRRLVQDLLDTVDDPGRAGLSANQIGVGLRAFSYNINGKIGYVLNRCWRRRAANSTVTKDACPFPACGTRPVAPITPACAASTWTATRSCWRQRLMGRMLQHETDHLDGHVYLDRLEKTERREALRYMREHAAK